MSRANRTSRSSSARTYPASSKPATISIRLPNDKPRPHVSSRSRWRRMSNIVAVGGRRLVWRAVAGGNNQHSSRNRLIFSNQRHAHASAGGAGNSLHQGGNRSSGGTRWHSQGPRSPTPRAVATLPASRLASSCHLLKFVAHHPTDDAFQRRQRLAQLGPLANLHQVEPQ